MIVCTVKYLWGPCSASYRGSQKTHTYRLIGETSTQLRWRTFAWWIILSHSSFFCILFVNFFHFFRVRFRHLSYSSYWGFRNFMRRALALGLIITYRLLVDDILTDNSKPPLPLPPPKAHSIPFPQSRLKLLEYLAALLTSPRDR